MQASPSAVLLISDIVDSTLMTARLGDEASSRLWASHDRLARALLPRWKAIEIDKSDGLLLLLDTVNDAIGFAADYHRALISLEPPLRARVAVHSGSLIKRENPSEEVALGAKRLEVDGVAKPTVARLMSVAAPSQTLLTAAAVAALRDAAGHRLYFHGHWQMKGLEEPIEAYGVGDGAHLEPQEGSKAWRVCRSPSDSRVWLPVRAIAHSLPAERDLFVGRQGALSQVHKRFDEGHRLLCLLGTGGIGKTRLALRFGWTHLGEYAGGVWFCDLSTARTLDGIAHAVAAGLKLPIPGSDPLDRIADALLSRGDCLLILDNFEQVTALAAPTLGRWLAMAPDLRVLVTSREVLGLPGEQIVPLQTLDGSEGVALFGQRAAAVRGDRLGDAEGASVPALVQVLDGLPLAIELAASRIGVMTPRQMIERIGARFELLTRRGSEGGRHAAMRATLDWSWDLLSTGEQAALARLSVFEGGFTLDAAESILQGLPSTAPGWPLDLVQALVQKSLVRTLPSRRMDLLRTVQDYAAEKLARGPDGPVAIAMHGCYFAGLADATDRGEHADDVENLVVATRRALRDGQLGIARQALLGSFNVLKRSGPLNVVLDMARELEGLATSAPEIRRVAQWLGGCAASAVGDPANAIARLRAALDGFEASDAIAARTHVALAESLARSARLEEANAHLDRAEAICEQLNDDRTLCVVLNERGNSLMNRSRLADAQHCFERVRQLAEAGQDRRWRCAALGNIGAIEHMLGHAERARLTYEAALAEARAIGEQRWAGNTLCNLGLLLQESGQHPQALDSFQQALAAARHLGHRRLEATTLCNLGLLEAARGQHAESVLHFQSAITVAARLDDPQSEGQALGYMALSLARLGRAEDAHKAFEAGAERLERVHDWLSLGLLHCARSESGMLQADRPLAEDGLARARWCLERSEAGSEDSELARRIRKLEALPMPPGRSAH